MKAPVPKWPWTVSSALFAISLIPSIKLRMSLWAVLALPFQWLYSPPLVYTDKPKYLTYSGGVVTAIAWSLSLVVMAMLIWHMRAKNEKA